MCSGLFSTTSGPIGLFDSGYGGLTIYRDIKRLLPQYDYIYLGDNARAPYGSLSFDVIYDYTLQAVRALFEQGCQLVILACNTASAKALRTIQEIDLPQLDPARRVLGIIRPTVEVIGDFTHNGHVGILGTQGTVQSQSYDIEIARFWPEITLTSQACPMWVPLVECGEYAGAGADYFVQKYIDELLAKDPLIDTLLLACTHYPLLYNKLRRYCPDHIMLVSQGKYVAERLAAYLDRHTALAQKLTQGATTRFLTTENAEKFMHACKSFLLTSGDVQVDHTTLGRCCP